MEYTINEINFYFCEGTVEIHHDGDIIGKKEIGLDTPERDFQK